MSHKDKPAAIASGLRETSPGDFRAGQEYKSETCWEFFRKVKVLHTESLGRGYAVTLFKY